MRFNDGREVPQEQMTRIVDDLDRRATPEDAALDRVRDPLPAGRVAKIRPRGLVLSNLHTVAPKGLIPFAHDQPAGTGGDDLGQNRPIR